MRSASDRERQLRNEDKAAAAAAESEADERAWERSGPLNIAHRIIHHIVKAVNIYFRTPDPLLIRSTLMTWRVVSV
jgi:hypothetical protein